MMRRRQRAGAAVASVIVALLIADVGRAAETPFIAGTAPDQRPSGAPVIAGMAKDPEWSARAAHGVAEPWPASVVGMLRDQGNWYTPFSRPGMTGPYDIRGMHAQLAQSGEPAMQVLATTPGWVCTRWTLAVPTISGAAPADGTARGATQPRWLCTQRTFLGPAASQLQPPAPSHVRRNDRAMAERRPSEPLRRRGESRSDIG